MICSMTGYAVKTRDIERGTLQLELKSVNSRYLDFHFRISEELRALEMPLRELLTQRLSRGKIECRLSFNAGTARAEQLQLNGCGTKALKMEEFLTDETFPRTHKAQYAMIFTKNEGIVVFGRKVDIQVGQLFKKLDTTKYVFEVVSLKADAMGTVHVQMRRRDEPSSRRTLAASVLLDPEQFEQIG